MATPARQRRVMAYFVLRLLLATALIALASLLVFRDPSSVPERWGLFGLAGLTFSFTGISAALARRHGQARWFLAAQFLFDTLLVTSLVVFTGGVDSDFYVLYFLNLFVLAYLTSGRKVMWLAGLNSAAYAIAGGTSLFGETGAFTSPLYTAILVRIFGLLLVGVLTSWLARRLRQADIALERERESTRALEETFRLIVESVRSGILLVNSERRVHIENPMAQECLGSVVGQTIDQVLPDLRPESTSQELQVTGPSGRRHLLCQLTPLGASDHSVVLFEDITALRTMEREKEREARLAGIGHFAAAIGHEVKNPLASLSGAIQMLAEERPGPLLDIAAREIHRLNDLVSDFLNSARPAEPSPQPTDLMALLAEVMAAFKNDPRYADMVTVSLHGEVRTPVNVDPDRFRQVIWNLILNAAQAMPGGGEVVITLEEDAGNLVLQVTDTGAGIRPEDLPRVFDPFYTTRQGGTGLGLATVERLVRDHGGTVDVRSAPEEGSVFRVRIPNTHQRDPERRSA